MRRRKHYLIAVAVSLIFAAQASRSRAATREVVVKGEDVSTTVMIASTQAVPGQKLKVTVDFAVAPGWHIYGEPLPPDYTVTKVTFDNSLVGMQSINFPKPKALKFPALNQTFPVYEGNFQATGDVQLKPRLTAGDHDLTGTIQFQECNDLECKMPQSLRFALPIQIKDAS